MPERLAASSSRHFASHTVQVTTDAKARPIITALTTMSAAMNMPKGDRSCGSAAGAVVGRGRTAEPPAASAGAGWPIAGKVPGVADEAPFASGTEVCAGAGEGVPGAAAPPAGAAVEAGGAIGAGVLGCATVVAGGGDDGFVGAAAVGTAGAGAAAGGAAVGA